MNSPGPPTAWQPLTFQGVAAFGDATWARTNTLLLVCAAIISGFVVWACNNSLIPDFEVAVSHLPDSGGIEEGRLYWPRELPDPLADGAFLGIVVTGDSRQPQSATSDWKIEVRQTMLHLCSILGCMDWPYPPRTTLQFSKSQVVPWWGAWKPAVLTSIGLSVFLLFLVAWYLLGFFYLWPIRLIAFFLDRKLTLAGAWRFSLASAVPGAFAFALATALYASHAIGLLTLLLAASSHLLVAWVYLAGGIVRLPTLYQASSNPFRPDGN